MLSELRALQRVLGITMQCKHASQKEKPREGTGLSGPYRVNECGNYAKAGITTPCVNKGDNSRILVQCDIGATEAGTEADAGVQRLALSQLSDDLLVGFLRKSLERDGAQITL